MHSSLSQDEIPIKLRCAICSKLAVNAFRLPCCEQAICEICTCERTSIHNLDKVLADQIGQSSLPSSCPVCEHTPVAAGDCKPNKSLRTTIRVFLRTEEKKREAVRLKDSKNTPPITPLTPATPVEAPTPIAQSDVAGSGNQAVEGPRAVQPTTGEITEQHTATKPLLEAQQDIPQPSIEVRS